MQIPALCLEGEESEILMRWVTSLCPALFSCTSSPWTASPWLPCPLAPCWLWPEGALAGDRRWGRAGIGSSCSATTVLRWLLPIVTAPPSTSSPTFQPSDTLPRLKVSASQCGQSWGASKPLLGCPCELYLHEKVSSKIVAECSICV